MDNKELVLKINISNENNHQEIICNQEKDIKEIKKECQNKLGFDNIDINNINLWFIDEDKEKNLISEFDDLINFSKENNPNYLSIDLIVEICNKYDGEIIANNKKEEKKINNDKYQILENYKNVFKHKDKIILQLKNEIEILKIKYKKYKNSVNSYKNLINYLVKISNTNSIKELKKKLKEQNKENNIHIKVQNNDKEQIKNDNLKNEKRIFLYKENFDFMKNKCNHCSNQDPSKIYRCVNCKDYYLCSNCHKENARKDKNNKYHEHNYFFEIKFPEKLLELMNLAKNKDEKFYSIIDKFNDFLNKIFFDGNGNFSSEKYDVNKKILKTLYKEMKSINESPLNYIEDYKINCLNFELEKLKNQDEEAEQIEYLIAEKISYLKINLDEIEKNII